MEKSIWQLQEELRQWHEKQYKQEYPNSEFYTGHTFVHQGETWEGLTPEQQERKERLAYKLNSMLFNMGVNISDNFKDKEQQ